MTTCKAAGLWIVAWVTLGLLLSSPAAGAEGEIEWHNILEVGIEGQAWADVETPFDRLPARAKGVVPDPVWGLSQHSAGLCARFVTNAPAIHCRWTLRSERYEMNHMPATGVSGVDLYVNDCGTWRWIAVGRVQRTLTNEMELVSGIPEGEHEFCLYLPLYNGVTEVFIGVPKGRSFGKAPAYPEDHSRPMVFWGTSILHGGCASRPGMAYPAILGRWLGRPSVNLGFSGNGKMDPELVELLTEVDASVFVIDCLPNMGPDLVTERTEPLVERLRAAHPDTPIVLVENIRYQEGAFIPGDRASYEAKNAALMAAFCRLVEKGIPNLHYVPCDALLGDDGEATVDGTHATDLGFLRMALAINPVLQYVFEQQQRAQ